MFMIMVLYKSDIHRSQIVMFSIANSYQASHTDISYYVTWEHTEIELPTV